MQDISLVHLIIVAYILRQIRLIVESIARMLGR